MCLSHWLQRQRVWSLQTFGPGRRTLGLISHIRKELQEIEADPMDPMEKIDLCILCLDGAWRTGIPLETIVGDWAMYDTKATAFNRADWKELIIGALGEAQKDPDNYRNWLLPAYLGRTQLSIMGYNWPEILTMLQAKQEVNFSREWPPWQPEDKPTEHIRGEE